MGSPAEYPAARRANTPNAVMFVRWLKDPSPRRERKQLGDRVAAGQRMHGRAAGVQREDRPLEVAGAVQARRFAAQCVEDRASAAANAQRIAPAGGEPDRRPRRVELAAGLPARRAEASVGVLRARQERDLPGDIQARDRRFRAGGTGPARRRGGTARSRSAPRRGASDGGDGAAARAAPGPPEAPAATTSDARIARGTAAIGCHAISRRARARTASAAAPARRPGRTGSSRPRAWRRSSGR